MASHIGLDDGGRAGSLLARNDPPPVRIVNPAGAASFLLLGDHAGNRVPQALDDLGVAAADRARHIGWDIGVGALGVLLAERLDAVFVRQTYSRLVVDCNRAPDAPDAMPTVSDGTPIPGNTALDPAARAARIAAIHRPYQAAIAAEIAARTAGGRETILVSLHSFTPQMQGVARPWEIGILHDAGDARFAQACLAWLQAESGRTIGDNEPYRMDLIDYTLPLHAYPAGLRYVEIEVRQDLVADDDGIAAVATTLADMLTAAAV